MFELWTWERPKRNNSARRLHFLNLTTSETKQFCETSSFFEVQDIKNEEFCETSFKNGKLSAELTDSYQCVLRFFQSTCLKYCACHGKLMPGHTKCCACHANHLSKPAHLVLQNATPLRKSAPWPPDISHEHVFCTAPATKMHLCRSSSNVPCLPSFLEMLQNPHVLVTFDKVHNPLRLPRETTSEPPKVARTCGVLYILTWKCASRHNGVHFSNISISKSGPNVVCFVHFDLEMCFAPKRRAIFHLSSGQLAADPPL